jgi:mRNA interferase RelE/StbE
VYRLEVSVAAKRDLQRLQDRMRASEYEHLLDEIESLIEDPRPQGIRKIQGEERTYRIRVGDFRVLYEMSDNTNIVEILQVGRRNEATYK